MSAALPVVKLLGWVIYVRDWDWIWTRSALGEQENLIIDNASHRPNDYHCQRHEKRVNHGDFLELMFLVFG